MRIVRYLDTDGLARHGELLPDGRVRVLDGTLFGDIVPTHRIAPAPGSLLAPLEPRAIIGIGQNYAAHAREMGSEPPRNPVVFLKLPGSVQHPGAPVRIPTHLRSDQVDYEAELAVVIGKPCRNATLANALSFVAGYTCANDISARDWQRTLGGGQWSRGKTFDSFCPLGPCLVTPDELPDPQCLRIRSRVNGETRQDSNTSDMIFSVAALISFLSADTLLEPGTVILTGTPAGVGMGMTPPTWLKPGDSVEIEIEGIGILRNPVE